MSKKLCMDCGENDILMFHPKKYTSCKVCMKSRHDNTMLSTAKMLFKSLSEQNSNTQSNDIQLYINGMKKKTTIRRSKRQDHLKFLITTEKILEGNKGDDYLFYVLRFISREDSRHSSFKYGITKYDIARRFRSYRFDIEIIGLYYGSEKFIRAVEKKVLLLTKEFIYQWPSHIYYDDSEENREFRTEIDIVLVEEIIMEENILLEQSNNV